MYQEHSVLPVVSSMWLLVPSANLQLVPTVNSSVAWVYGEGRQPPPPDKASLRYLSSTSKPQVPALGWPLQ